MPIGGRGGSCPRVNSSPSTGSTCLLILSSPSVLEGKCHHMAFAIIQAHAHGIRSYRESLLPHFIVLARIPTSSNSVLVTSITSSSATIQWMLTDPYIPSLPETFTVLYGNSSGQLNFNTPEITANSNSQTYSTQLSSLQPGTVYFYRIQAINRFGSNSTGVMSFTTSDRSEYSLLIKIPNLNVFFSVQCSD